MNSQTWYLTLTCLVLVSGVFECKEYMSSKNEISEGHNTQEGDDVCCNPDLMQSISAIIQEAKEDDFNILVKNFNELKSVLEYTMPDDVQEEYISNNLQTVACNLIKDSKYWTCSCDSPVIRKLKEERMEKITMMHTTYTNELSELKELFNKLKFLVEQSIEEGFIEKELKGLVCKQCKGSRDPIFMFECQQLMELGNSFKEKKLEEMETVVKLIQVKVKTLSKQIQEINSVAENAMESLKENINQLIQAATELNLTSCDEVFEVPKPDPELGAGCTTLPVKCVPSNKASCTLNNCKDQCKVNCCNGASSSKCTIPTCKGCKNAAATATCTANTANQCAGLTSDNDLNGRLNEIDQIERSEIEIQDPELGAGCTTLPPKCNQSNKASCTLNNCKDQCKVNCCNGASNNKCTIPTCKGCRNVTTCTDATARQCAGVSKDNGLNGRLSQVYNLDIQIEETEIEIQDPEISCATLPVRCDRTNPSSCTPENCIDECQIRCCNGSYQLRCTIPMCTKCVGGEEEFCEAKRKARCAGLTSHKGIHGILNEIYKLEDRIEESEIMLEIKRKNTCQRLLETLEDANIVKDPQGEMGNDMNEIQDSVDILLPDEMNEEMT